MSGTIASQLPELAVVIPAYNGGDQLVRCLESIADLDYPAVRVIVVDNASTDGSVARAAAINPDMEVLSQERNRGYATACNAGLERCLAEDIPLALILNQDTWVDPGLALSLVAAMGRRERAAIVAPKTYYPRADAAGRSLLIYAGAFERRFWPLRYRLPGQGEPDSGQFEQPCRVDVVWGHGLLVRTAAVADVGLFDARFFLYHEDIDLCRRLIEAGYELWYEPTAVMWHDVSDLDRARESQAWRWRHKVDSAWILHRKDAGPVRAAGLTVLTELHEALHLLRLGRVRALTHLALAVGGLPGRLRTCGVAPRSTPHTDVRGPSS